MVKHEYNVRDYVQHIATRDVFRVIKRRGMINTHYMLKLVHTKYKYNIGTNTEWLAETNLNEFYSKLNKEQVKLFYVE